MADAWLPAAGRMPAGYDGGSLKGGAPRAVWFTSESDPDVVSARSVAQELQCRRQAAHLIWNPVMGDIVQMVAVTRAGGLLTDPIGNEGRICAQIVVVGHAREPFTDGALSGLDEIIHWLDSWHVPRRWPAGPPLPPPQSFNCDRDRRVWARGGHFGCSQVPGMHRPDPGRIDIWKITGPDASLATVPRPRTADDAEPVPELDARLATGNLLLRSKGATRAFPQAVARGGRASHPGPGGLPAAAGEPASRRAVSAGQTPQSAPPTAHGPQDLPEPPDLPEPDDPHDPQDPHDHRLVVPAQPAVRALPAERTEPQWVERLDGADRLDGAGPAPNAAGQSAPAGVPLRQPPVPARASMPS